jgi:tRNA-2-methylthio-N6-dimethylallyladenosine synthase
MKFFIKTFGCQMNVNDSEKIASILFAGGISRTDNPDQADIIVINSCAVRKKSEEKLYSYIGRIDKDKTIITAGCVSQTKKEDIKKKFPHISLIIGTHQYYQIGKLLDEIKTEKKARIISVDYSDKWQEFVPQTDFRTDDSSAYISIMEGCNNFCSYCIVPYTRGREKFRPLKNILQEAGDVDSKGFKEIILLGQNVNNWSDQKLNLNFPDLLRILAEETSVKWIRFITSYPGYYEKEIIAVMQNNRRIARHIHFPAQSGSTRILKKMKRKYSRAEYLKIIKDFYRNIPGIRFSSDFIVGFPGETEHDFNLTLSLIKEIQYDSLFSFLYSPRKFTQSSKFKETISLAEKKSRIYRLQRLQAEIQLKNNQKLVGRTIEVLVKHKNSRNPLEMSGRNETLKVVNFISDSRPGDLVKVEITRASPHALKGIEVKNQIRS